MKPPCTYTTPHSKHKSTTISSAVTITQTRDTNRHYTSKYTVKYTKYTSPLAHLQHQQESPAASTLIDLVCSGTITDVARSHSTGQLR